MDSTSNTSPIREYLVMTPEQTILDFVVGQKLGGNTGCWLRVQPRDGAGGIGKA